MVTKEAGIYVNSSGRGVVFGDVKNFRMSNPANPSEEIWYASLEGPEAAAYVRGTAQLVNGRATVRFPEHFRSVANAQGMTIMLTPHSAESLGLAAVDRSESGFEIQELMSGKGSYNVDWEVKAVRRGFEDYQVIRPVQENSGYIDDGGPGDPKAGKNEK